MGVFLELLAFVFAPVALLAGLALKFGGESRPGFDHRELRDQGPPNV